MSKAKRQRRKEDRPGEIIQAAMEVFSESGFGNAKIIDIARRAGVAKGTVYLYFATKDQLFEAVVRQYINPAFAQVERILATFAGSTGDLLAEVIRRLYREMANNVQRRAIMRILITEGERFPNLTAFYHREVLASAQQLIRQILHRGIESGEFRQTAAVDFPGVVVGPVVMAAVWKLTFNSTEPLDTERFCEAHLDVVLNGLRQR